MSVKYADTYCILYIEYKQYNRMVIKCWCGIHNLSKSHRKNMLTVM